MGKTRLVTSNVVAQNKCSIKVEFFDNLAIDQSLQIINSLHNPQIVLWYMGSHGLRKTGVDFYRDFLIQPILQQHASAALWLVDLTAWAAFKSPYCSIDASNSCCEKIEEFAEERIKCFKASDIFKKMEAISDPDTITYFRKALHRSFIQKISQSFPNRNIFVREILSKGCPIMADWFDYDVGKVYSVFQYLEGCLLVETIFLYLLKNKCSNAQEIVFLLPNDELKYYRDSHSSFRKDLEFLLQKKCNTLNLEDVNLSVKFVSFPFGTKQEDRPYNSPGKVVKKNSLSLEAVAGPIKKSASNAWDRYASKH